jgi:hypothetical protein
MQSATNLKRNLKANRKWIVETGIEEENQVLTLKMGHLERKVHSKRQSLDSARDLKVQPGRRKPSPAEKKFDGKYLQLDNYQIGSGALEPTVLASAQVPNEVPQLSPPSLA